ncbi:hypothetical protein AAX28_00572 [Arcobacter porcinus]|uniref:Uncharacterized protein n=1 Tax=Arcobacter porcinus TaxID=1935204 RepID=A0ABX2YDQ2_9BACT|nr:hypothetical protein AAX28_00572 [Arcobacter porcinus]
MVTYTAIISSIFSIVLIFQFFTVLVKKAIETIQNARDSY